MPQNDDFLPTQAPKRRRRGRKVLRKNKLNRRRVVLVCLVAVLAVTGLGFGVWAIVSRFSGNEPPPPISPSQTSSADEKSLSSGEPAATSSQGGSDNQELSSSPETPTSSATGVAVSAASPQASPNLYDEPALPPLFNKDHYIPGDYTIEKISVGRRGGNGEEQFMEARAGQAFLAMYAAAADEGLDLNPYSGFRTHQRQQNNYNNAVQNYISQGKSQEEAERLTRLYYAIPGTSEHEAGLAIDIDGVAEGFENTADFVWLQQHAATFGFILRYQKNTTDITGVAYEPWHYRYVGANHAAKIVELGITLEEYLG